MPANSEKKKIVCVHLLNDYSGSPLILSMVIKGLVHSGHAVDLITSEGKDGFLSNLPINYRSFNYRFHQNKWIRLYRFFKSQVAIFFMILSYRRENVHIYINTLLPFGAALAGKFTVKKITYHLHESYIQPVVLKNFLKKVAAWCAESAIYVSNYLMEAEQLKGVKNTVIYNALPNEFTEKAKHDYYLQEKKDFIVLMISSLKEYKGINEFVMLAVKMQELKFELVLNCNQEQIDKYFEDITLPNNLLCYPVQKDVHPFYRRASLVVNLSNPAQCVETFGMTLLEGMCYGLPVIGPTVGGPVEVVKDGYNGFSIDSRSIDMVAQAVNRIYRDKELQLHLSQGAIKTSSNFDEKMLNQQIAEKLRK